MGGCGGFKWWSRVCAEFIAALEVNVDNRPRVQIICKPSNVSSIVHRLEAEKSRASAQSRAEAKRHAEDEVSRILSAERAAAEDGIQQAAIRERIAAEEEKRRAQLYVSPRISQTFVNFFGEARTSTEVNLACGKSTGYGSLANVRSVGV